MTKYPMILDKQAVPALPIYTDQTEDDITHL